MAVNTSMKVSAGTAMRAPRLSGPAAMTAVAPIAAENGPRQSRCQWASVALPVGDDLGDAGDGRPVLATELQPGLPQLGDLVVKLPLVAALEVQVVEVGQLDSLAGSLVEHRIGAREVPARVLLDTDLLDVGPAHPSGSPGDRDL